MVNTGDNNNIMKIEVTKYKLNLINHGGNLKGSGIFIKSMGTCNALTKVNIIAARIASHILPCLLVKLFLKHDLNNPKINTI